MEQNELFSTTQSVEADIISAGRAKSVWLWIADHADEINAKGVGASFGLWQSMALTEMIAAIGRVYDEGKEADASIKNLLKCVAHLPIVAADRFFKSNIFNDDQIKNMEEFELKDMKTKALNYLCGNRPTYRNDQLLRRIMDIRHNEIAHKSTDLSYERPTFEDMDYLINWAETFIRILRESFVIGYQSGNSEPHDRRIAAEATAVMGLRKLAHMANIVVDHKFAVPTA